MSEFSGLWKHENNQHALVPLKTECGCPSGRGIKNGHIRYPSMEERRKKMKKNDVKTFWGSLDWFCYHLLQMGEVCMILIL